MAFSAAQGPGQLARREPRGAAQWLALAAVWLSYSALASRFWFATDDSFISFRYARNFARGHGLRYNLGPEAPVEGYSNFLWTFYCAGIEALGWDPAFWACFLSFLCGALLLALVFRTMLDRFELSLPVAFLATLGLALFPPFAVWSTGGLETMPFALLFFLTFERLILRRAGIAVVGSVAAGIGLALVRVEGLAWALLLGVMAILARRWMSQRSIGPAARYFALLLAVYGIYFAWRFAYYGLPFPNTAYAKVGLSTAVLEQGFAYIAVYFLTFLTPFVALFAVPAAWNARWRAPGAMAAAVALGTVAYPVLVGGDFMAMGRFLVPGLPFQALVCACLFQLLWSKAGAVRTAGAAACVAFIVLALLPAWNVHAVPTWVRSPFHFRENRNQQLSEYEQWCYMRDNTRRWRAKGLAMKSYAKPEDTVVAGAIGCFGYFSELYIYDKAGLVNHEVAVRDESPVRKKSPGHKKGVHSSFFLDRRPTYMEVKLFTGDRMHRDVLKESQNWREMSRSKLQGRYVADFQVFPGRDDGFPPRVLLVLRRREGQGDLDRLWDDFFARVEAYPWTELAVLPEDSAQFGAEAEE